MTSGWGRPRGARQLPGDLALNLSPVLLSPGHAPSLWATGEEILASQD